MEYHNDRALFFAALRKLEGHHRTWHRLPPEVRDPIINKLVGSTKSLEAMRLAISKEISKVMDAI